MEKLGNKKITANELTFILIGIMLDVSVAGLPNRVTKIAKQDGWISVILGAIYPLYVALLAIYVSKNHPDENILILSKKYLGTVVGTFLNILFLFSFFSYYPPLVSLVATIGRTYVVPFLSGTKIYVFTIVLGIFCARKGLKVIGKICTIAFYLVLVIIIVSTFVIKDGSVLNISPILGSGVKNILAGIIESGYDYALLELAFILYPFIDDKSKTKKAILNSVLYSWLIYVWITFISIYYIGSEVISKTYWAFFSVTEGIKLEILNNFRYIFIFFWLIVAMKSATLINYIFGVFLEDIRGKKIDIGTYMVIGGIVLFLIVNYYKENLSRNMMIEVTSKYSIIFNFIYITLISVLIFISKRGNKHEKE